MTTGETMYLIDDNGGSEIYFIKCLELGCSWFADWLFVVVLKNHLIPIYEKVNVRFWSLIQSQLENEADTFFRAKRDFSSIRV